MSTRDHASASETSAAPAKPSEPQTSAVTTASDKQASPPNDASQLKRAATRNRKEILEHADKWWLDNIAAANAIASQSRQERIQAWAIFPDLRVNLLADESPRLYKRKKNAERQLDRAPDARRLHSTVLPMISKNGPPVHGPSLGTVWDKVQPQNLTAMPPEQNPLFWSALRWLEATPPHDPLCCLAREFGFSEIEEKVWRMPHHIFTIKALAQPVELLRLALEELYALIEADNRPATWRSWEMHRHIEKLRQAIRDTFGDHISSAVLDDAVYKTRVFVNAYAETLDGRDRQTGPTVICPGVSRAVAEYQTKHGLTLERTAERLGIDRKTLYKARTCHPIRRDQIAQIADKLNTTVEDLLRA